MDTFLGLPLCAWSGEDLVRWFRANNTTGSKFYGCSGRELLRARRDEEAKAIIGAISDARGQVLRYYKAREEAAAHRRALGTPTVGPSGTPANSPTMGPSGTPTMGPSGTPAAGPSGTPANSPTMGPSGTPANSPTNCARWKNVHEFDGRLPAHLAPPAPPDGVLDGALRRFMDTENLRDAARRMVEIILKDKKGNHDSNNPNFDASVLLYWIAEKVREMPPCSEDRAKFVENISEQLEDCYKLGQCPSGRVVRMWQLYSTVK